MSIPVLTKDALFGLLNIGPPSAKEMEKARAKQQAKADKAAKEQEKKQSKATQKAAIRSSTDKPIYEDTARPGVDAAIEELQALPGAHEALDKLMTLRRDAAALAEAGKYSEAVALLKPVKDLRSEGVKKAANSDKSARKSFAPLFDSADKLRGLLSSNTPVLSERYRAALASEIDIAVAVLYLPGATGSEAEMVQESLAALKDDLDRAVLEAGALKTDGDQSLKLADDLLIELKECATEGEVARIKTLVDGARTLQAEREYGEAKDAADEAVHAGGAIRDAARLAKTRWDTAAVKVNAQLAASRALAARRDAPTLTEVTPTAREVVDGWTELAADAKTLPGFIGFEQAVQTYDLLTAQLADLDARAKTDAALGPLRKSANDRVLEALEEVDDKLGELHKRVADFFPDRDEKDLDGPFLDEKAAAEAAWSQGMRRVASDKELLALSDSIMKKLSAACARIDKVIGDVGSFTDAVVDRDVQIARERFETARQSCAGVIDSVLSAHAPAGIQQADLLDALVKQEAAARSPDAIEGLAKRVEILAAKTQMQVKKYAGDSEKAKVRVAEQLKSAEDKLATLTALIAEKSKLDWIREPTRERDYGELRDVLKEQLEQQRPLARMSEAGILDECEGDLIALNFSISSAIAAIKGGKEAKALNVSSISSMSEEITKLRERLNKHDVVKYSAALQLELSGSLDTLATELKSIPLEQARMRINAFEKDLAAAEVATLKARAAYKKFETDVADVGKLLKDSAFAKAGDYKKVLKGKLDKCRGDALAGGVTPEATAALAAIDTEIKTAKGDPQACKAGQDSAGADARKAEQDAAEWKSRYEIVTAAISANTTILTKERAELTQLAEMANKVYKRTKDMQAATMQLRIVNDRIDFLQKYPDGMDVAARNKLPKLRDRWKQAVADLKAGLDQLIEEVNKRSPADVPAPGAKAVADSIASVKNLFDPVLFDAAVDAMNSKKRPKRELSEIREQALRAVHRAQAVFEADQRMVDLSGNPFKPGINRLIANASLALAEFETNLLISL
jgi:hypothetical protein